jgi:hypothetical protein
MLALAMSLVVGVCKPGFAAEGSQSSGKTWTVVYGYPVEEESEPEIEPEDLDLEPWDDEVLNPFGDDEAMLDILGEMVATRSCPWTLYEDRGVPTPSPSTTRIVLIEVSQDTEIRVFANTAYSLDTFAYSAGVPGPGTLKFGVSTIKSITNTAMANYGNALSSSFETSLGGTIGQQGVAQVSTAIKSSVGSTQVTTYGAQISSSTTMQYTVEGTWSVPDKEYWIATAYQVMASSTYRAMNVFDNGVDDPILTIYNLGTTNIPTAGILVGLKKYH